MRAILILHPFGAALSFAIDQILPHNLDRFCVNPRDYPILPCVSLDCFVDEEESSGSRLGLVGSRRKTCLSESVC